MTAQPDRGAVIGTHPDGRVRFGGPVRKRARRAELRRMILAHVGEHRHLWFTAVELARVIREQLGEPIPPSGRGCHYGRSNITMTLLRELAAEGQVTSRPHPERRGATQWRLDP